MGKKKVYAIKKGIKTGKFYTWKEAETYVKGYNGAEYKSFATEEEADVYLNGGNEPEVDMSKINRTIEFYTDGSYKELENSIHCGYGLVVIENKELIFKDCGKIIQKDSPSRNVIGELYAIRRVIEISLANGFTKENNVLIHIYYDYNGVERFATGAYTPSADISKKYADFMKKHMDKFNIKFTHIKGHSGHKWNELADDLAAIGANY